MFSCASPHNCSSGFGSCDHFIYDFASLCGYGYRGVGMYLYVSVSTVCRYLYSSPPHLATSYRQSRFSCLVFHCRIYVVTHWRSASLWLWCCLVVWLYRLYMVVCRSSYVHLSLAPFLCIALRVVGVGSGLWQLAIVLFAISLVMVPGLASGVVLVFHLSLSRSLCLSRQWLCVWPVYLQLSPIMVLHIIVPPYLAGAFSVSSGVAFSTAFSTFSPPVVRLIPSVLSLSLSLTHTHTLSLWFSHSFSHSVVHSFDPSCPHFFTHGRACIFQLIHQQEV